MLLFSIVVMCSYRADKIFTLPFDTLQIALPLMMYFIIVFFFAWFLCRRANLNTPLLALYRLILGIFQSGFCGNYWPFGRSACIIVACAVGDKSKA